MRLDGDAWRTLFDSFETSAFRLETLPAYDVASEREEYETFLKTGQLVIPPEDPWLTRVRHFRAIGRTIGRVHVLTRPLSDYLRYEFAVYAYTTAAGEDVRILDLTDQPNPGLPSQDFWLFDERQVVRMDYDESGVQLGRELLEAVDPAPYVAWKQLALTYAVPFAKYRATLEP
ncbi:DUF6879 family protein [Actinocorallia aurantiaca]|uniref:DUF6879 domain-containing protein n=1 Tax=Actinocorallia aurantiaca TaxID=46204 RepID=A0ABP6HB29_9ACTN